MEKNENRPNYFIDTLRYWSSDEEYNNKSKQFGKFINNGTGYEIFDKNTPRPWLNYLCNDNFGSIVSNTGLGYSFYKTLLYRITKYDHPMDYVPRSLVDGRVLKIMDLDNGKEWEFFTECKNLICTHNPGFTIIKGEIDSLTVEVIFFVPNEDMCECWSAFVKNTGRNLRNITITAEQVWSFAYFLNETPIQGESFAVKVDGNKIIAHSINKTISVDLYGTFMSPDSLQAKVTELSGIDDYKITYSKCSLMSKYTLLSSGENRMDVISGISENESSLQKLIQKYNTGTVFDKELHDVKIKWDNLLSYPKCDIPDENMQNFLNVWLKNQIYLTFRYVRAGFVGFRDTFQDSWAYLLLDPDRAKKQILFMLSKILRSGSCPRQYDVFEHDHDMRNYLDSGTWIPITLAGYVKETGDFSILNEQISWFDDDAKSSVADHVWAALDLLYENRHKDTGICITGDGDWNDALEGISKYGDAQSVWLTEALYNAQCIMAELLEKAGDTERGSVLRSRSESLKKIVNEKAWDGEWFVYGFTGTGKPIGSHTNKEGKIHLNAQTWAIFTGLADLEKIPVIRESINKHLSTPIGPMLLTPPYIEEAKEVGRIANLEPGTFENAAVYQHAVTFKIFADLQSGHYDDAYNTFINLLPTNPKNPDSRRTSEPYCTGNFYCGSSHPRFGQNFYSWFTASASWLFRAGFDEICGVKADYDGLRINPKVPQSWNHYSVCRKFRGTIYNIVFIRSGKGQEKGIWVDGKKNLEHVIRPTLTDKADVTVFF